MLTYTILTIIAIILFVVGMVYERYWLVVAALFVWWFLERMCHSVIGCSWYKDMIEIKCKHVWRFVNERVDSSNPSVYKCKKCAIIMNAPEVFQLEALENQTGFQKYISIIAIVISFVALLVSIEKW